MEIKAYRIRVKGTQLYYQPVKGRWRGEKSNFSPRGKVYLTKPSLDHIAGHSISDALVSKYALKYREKSWEKGQKCLAEGYEFEVVSYTLVED